MSDRSIPVGPPSAAAGLVAWRARAAPPRGGGGPDGGSAAAPGLSTANGRARATTGAARVGPPAASAVPPNAPAHLRAPTPAPSPRSSPKAKSRLLLGALVDVRRLYKNPNQAVRHQNPRRHTASPKAADRRHGSTRRPTPRYVHVYRYVGRLSAASISVTRQRPFSASAKRRLLRSARRPQIKGKMWYSRVEHGTRCSGVRRDAGTRQDVTLRPHTVNRLHDQEHGETPWRFRVRHQSRLLERKRRRRRAQQEAQAMHKALGAPQVRRPFDAQLGGERVDR